MTESPRRFKSAVTCLRCGHTLTGVEHSGNCPECGSSVDDSLMKGPNVRGILAPNRKLLRLVVANVGGLGVLLLIALLIAWLLR